MKQIRENETIKQAKTHYNVRIIIFIATFNLYKFTLKSRSSKGHYVYVCIMVKFHIFRTVFVWVREVFVWVREVFI